MLYREIESKIKDHDASLEHITKDKSVNKIIEKMYKKQTVTGVAFGDSMTWGYVGQGTQTDKNYPLMLQKRLRYMYSNDNINIINSGLSGATTTVGLAYFKTKVLDNKPDFCIIMFGLNDLNSNIDIATYENNLKQMIKLCADNNILVILCSPTMAIVRTIGSFSSEYNLYLKDYQNVCKSLSLNQNIDFVDMFEEFSILWKTQSIDTSFYDGNIHLKDYTIICDILLKNKLSIFKSEFKDGDVIPFSSGLILNNPFNYADISGSKFKTYYNINNTKGNIRFCIYATKNTKTNIYCLGGGNISSITPMNFGVDLEKIGITSGGNANDLTFNIPLSVGFNLIELDKTKLEDITKIFSSSGIDITDKIESESLSEEVYSLTLQNNWVGSPTYGNLKAIKLGNIVSFSGLISNGIATNGTVITILPSELIPKGTMNKLIPVFSATGVNSGQVGFIDISKNTGEVKIFSNIESGYIAFEGVSYYLN